MPRFARPGTIEQFQLALHTIIARQLRDAGNEDYLQEGDPRDPNYDWEGLVAGYMACTEPECQVRKDLAKIEFDFENTLIGYPDNPMGRDNFYGFHLSAADGGFPFLGLYSGGDWEEPVSYVLYVDDKNALRAYVPTDGNVYNAKTKKAFGNDEESDEKQLAELGKPNAEDLWADPAKMSAAVLGRIVAREPAKSLPWPGAAHFVTPRP